MSRATWIQSTAACTRVPLAVLTLLALTLVDPAGAAIATLDAAKDNTIYSEGDLSNGAGDYIFAGRVNGDSLRRALIQFDIAGAIPTGSTINSVTLTLTRNKGKNASPSMSLHRLLAAWGEGASDAPAEEGGGASATTGDATWVHTFYPTMMWGSLGGDYAGTASATTVVGNSNGPYTWSSATMVSDVQGWLDTPSSNHGWILIGDESTKRSTRRFDSRTSPTVTARPKLEIDFTPTVVSGGCCLGDSCALLTDSECANQGGVYQGDGTSCSPNPCAVATGACCFDDGTCNELTQTDCLAQGGTYQGDLTTCTPGLCPLVLEAYVDSLPRPAVAVPVTGNPGAEATYDIAITQFQQELHRDLPPTTVWGYGGSFPGPTIEAFRDQQVTVTWRNDLRDSLGALRTDHYLPVDLCPHGASNEPKTVVHLHGAHVEAASDGYPENTILPGAQQIYVYPNHQLPGTLWYHDHALGITRLNVMMGLAGFYILRDSTEIDLGLPSGEFEIPLVIQDRSFNSDGSLIYPSLWQEHFFGDKILVNGKVWPYLNVKQGKYRFRVLDGSNSRAYTLKLSTGDPFTIVGTEGGLLPAPVVRDSITITPGERIDVIVDFAAHPAGTEILLQNSAPAPFPGSPGSGVVPEVMKFVVVGQPGYTAPIPPTLRPFEALQDSTAVEIRDFELVKLTDPCAGSIWTINGLHWNDITERPILGTTEVWRFINRSGIAHPMHMHLVMFQALDRQPVTIIGDSIVPTGPAVPVGSEEAGWKDTIPVYPDEMVRVIARFEDYAGLYPYHCHILEHEDHEMMRQFESVEAVTADLALTKGVDNPAPSEGGTVVYGVTLANNGPDAAVNVTVMDALPSGVTYVSSTATAGSYDPGTGHWSLGLLQPAVTDTLHITVTVDAGAAGSTITNEAFVTALDQTDPVATNDSASVDITVQVMSADLALGKTVDISSPVPGDSIAYTVTLTNNGPDGATHVTVTDVLPAGVSFVSSTTTTGTYDDVTGFWTVSGVAVTSTDTLRIMATVDPGTYGTTIGNTASVTASDQDDPVPVNNTANVDITVQSTSAVGEPRLPSVYALQPIGPSPFRQSTTIRFDVPQPGPARLAIYDVSGQLVTTLFHGQANPGRYAPQWDGRDATGRPVPAGIYLVRLEAGSFSATQKVVRMR